MCSLQEVKVMMRWKIMIALICFRLLNALMVRTSFTPDEFWQGPEPAHLLAFGKGHLTWEWEPSARIRGFTHPLIFAGIYKALELMGWDSRWAVAHSPKLFQGLMAGVCDYYTFGLALRVFGAAAARWALLFQVLSWFNIYCLVRPYSNSAEAVIATAALFCWAPFFLTMSGRGKIAPCLDSPARSGGLGESSALLLAALCVAVRPTSAALWTVVGLVRLAKLPPRSWPRYLALVVLPPVVAVVGASFCLDSILHGATTLVPLNFLRFNVLEGQSRIFGEQAWHWNFSQGLPAVLGVALPAVLWGFYRSAAGDRRLGWFAVWFLVYHSTSPHKELRFLLPVLPIAHTYAGQAVASFIAAGSSASPPTRPEDEDAADPVGSPGGGQPRRPKRRALIVVCLVVVLHVPAAVYLSVWHQSGALSAVDAVADRITAAAKSTGDSAIGRVDGGCVTVTVHFLMPCHAAPLHSHLHFRDVETDLRFLDCSPTNRALPGGSESDRFQADPLGFLESFYGDGRGGGGRGTAALPPPGLVIMYSTHLERPGVDRFLNGLGLVVVDTFFNAHVNGDADCDDTHRSVAVLERTGAGAVCRTEERESCVRSDG